MHWLDAQCVIRLFYENKIDICQSASGCVGSLRIFGLWSVALPQTRGSVLSFRTPLWHIIGLLFSTYNYLYHLISNSISYAACNFINYLLSLLLFFLLRTWQKLK